MWPAVLPAPERSTAGVSRKPAPERDHWRACVDLWVLVSELLDAHADTVTLSDSLSDDPRWAAHLDYLRALQRHGKRSLAHSRLEVPA
jgi:hypothetical protein